MADAWETLLDNSTLTPPGFDAWEHLNNQSGISWDGILRDGLDVEVGMSCFDVEITVDLEVLVDTQPEYEVEIDTNEYEVEICDG